MNKEDDLEYLTDGERHLICIPYSRENLDKMADALGIKRCWYHRSKYPHYDIPKRRIAEIEAKCRKVKTKEILQIIKESLNITSDQVKQDNLS